MMSSPSQSSKWMSFFAENLLEVEEHVEEPHPLSAFQWDGTNQGDPQTESDELDKTCSQKRKRDEACGGAGSKACREKLRRDRLNDSYRNLKNSVTEEFLSNKMSWNICKSDSLGFLELSSALEPGRIPKTDKAIILSDAVRVVHQLRTEAQELKDSNHLLRVSIKELKAEKNELRDEKLMLKADKERLEQQLKAMTVPPGYIPHPAVHAAAAYAAQTQAATNKAAQLAGYRGMPMWQWMPSAAVDTSQDHVLRPPVA